MEMFRDAPHYTSLRLRAISGMDYQHMGDTVYGDHIDQRRRNHGTRPSKMDRNLQFKVWTLICFVFSQCVFIISVSYSDIFKDNRLTYKLNKRNIVVGVSVPNKTIQPVHAERLKRFSIIDGEVNESLSNYGAYMMLYPSYSMLPPFTLDTEGGYSPTLWAHPETSRTFSALKNPDLTGILAVIKDGVYGPESTCGRNSKLGEYSRLRVGAEVQYVSYLLPLLGEEKCTFEYFMTELLPRIAQAKDFLQVPSLTVLMEKTCDYHAFSVLKMLNVKHIVKEREDSVSYVSDYLIHSCLAPLMHPHLWGNARALFKISNAPLTHQRSRPPRVLLAMSLRKRTVNPLLNEDKVIKLLNQRFRNVTVFRGNQNFDRVREAFAQSDVIISGAREPVLSNIVFSPVNSHVIEIFPTLPTGRYVIRDQSRANVIWRLARTLGHKYYRMFEEPRGNLGMFRVRLSNLDELIDIVLENYYSESI